MCAGGVVYRDIPTQAPHSQRIQVGAPCTKALVAVLHVLPHLGGAQLACMGSTAMQQLGVTQRMAMRAPGLGGHWTGHGQGW